MSVAAIRVRLAIDAVGSLSAALAAFQRASVTDFRQSTHVPNTSKNRHFGLFWTDIFFLITRWLLSCGRSQTINCKSEPPKICGTGPPGIYEQPTTTPLDSRKQVRIEGFPGSFGKLQYTLPFHFHFSDFGRSSSSLLQSNEDPLPQP